MDCVEAPLTDHKKATNVFLLLAAERGFFDQVVWRLFRHMVLEYTDPTPPGPVLPVGRDPDRHEGLGGEDQVGAGGPAGAGGPRRARLPPHRHLEARHTQVPHTHTPPTVFSKF